MPKPGGSNWGNHWSLHYSISCLWISANAQEQTASSWYMPFHPSPGFERWGKSHKFSIKKKGNWNSLSGRHMKATQWCWAINQTDLSRIWVSDSGRERGQSLLRTTQQCAYNKAVVPITNTHHDTSLENSNTWKRNSLVSRQTTSGLGTHSSLQDKTEDK